MVIFALLKYNVFYEIQLTSSKTHRTLTGDAVHILLFPLCYILFGKNFWERHPLFTLFFLFLVALGIHFSGHRSGWLAFFLILALWFFYLPKKLRLAWLPFWAISLALILVISFFTTNFKAGTPSGDFLIRIHDTFDLENTTTIERMEKLKLSCDILRNNPFLGLGRFPMYSSSVKEENLTVLKSLQLTLDLPTHNLIASQAVHEGLMGLLILGFFLYVIFTQLTGEKLKNFEYRDFLTVYILAFIFYSLFNTSFNNPSGKIFFYFSIGILNTGILKDRVFKTKYKQAK